jgi:hypothetical protein
MKPETPLPVKRLITSSILYMGIILIGAIIAIIENLPAEAAGLKSNAPVWQGFLYGYGTAMSPPLYWLIVQAILTALASRRGRWGTVGIVGLIATGLLYSIFGALEPIVQKIFNPAAFDLLKVIIISGGIVLAVLMVVFGLLELVRRSRSRKIGPLPAA